MRVYCKMKKRGNLTPIEEEAVNTIYDILVSYTKGCASTETYETLEAADFFEGEDHADINRVNEEFFPDDEKETHIQESFSLESIDTIAKLYNGGRSFASISKLYPRLRSRSQLHRVLEYSKKLGTTRQLQEQIKETVWEKFKTARLNNLPVHDRDLRRWALQEAKKLNLNKFKCSEKFIFNSKESLGISSRKVVKVVTAQKAEEEDNLMETAFNHIVRVNDCMSKYEICMNADQSGFLYEFVSTRTLSFTGEKNTQAVAQNINKTTHSYTIMPIISSEGKLLSPLFICLQEVTGNEFGPNVQRAVSEALPSNVVVSCSKSGKMTKLHVETWVKKCLAPNCTGRSLLLVDSWSGQNQATLTSHFADQSQSADDEEHPEDCSCGETLLDVMTIPPGTTAIVQPEDKILFRQWKVIERTFYNFLALDEVPFVNDRLNIIRLQSLVHNQLQARAFTDMLRYRWTGCGYLTSIDPVDKFKVVKDICFTWDRDETHCEECENSIFISCAHCNKLLCITHFMAFTCFH